MKFLPQLLAVPSDLLFPGRVTDSLNVLDCVTLRSNHNCVRRVDPRIKSEDDILMAVIPDPIVNPPLSAIATFPPPHPPAGGGEQVWRKIIKSPHRTNRFHTFVLKMYR